VINVASLDYQGKRRPVLYEGSLSEMYVPYMDPEETWNSHVFSGLRRVLHEHRIGYSQAFCRKGVDLPGLRDPTSVARFFPREWDSIRFAPQLACMFERTLGDPGVGGIGSTTDQLAGLDGSWFFPQYCGGG